MKGIIFLAVVWLCMAGGLTVMYVQSNKQLAISQTKETGIVIYGATWCRYCHMAVEMLKVRGIPFTVYWVDKDPSKREGMRTDIKTVPQIFINGEYIGGYNDLRDYINGK